MESDIITAYASANDALEDSGVDVTVRVVHMAQVKTMARSRERLRVVEAHRAVVCV